MSYPSRPILVGLALGLLVALLVVAPRGTPAGAPLAQRSAHGSTLASVSDAVPSAEGPIVGELAIPSVSPALRDMPPITERFPALERELNPRQNREGFLVGPQKENADGPPDPLLERAAQPTGFTPAPTLNFEGISFATGGTGSPPDTVGEVGPNHYVQMVNGSIQIFNKSGTTLTGPVASNSIWSGFGGPCQTRNDGDPIVLYDELADRWLLSQFTTASPFMICAAVSTTPDPTGTYHRYAFNVASSIPDYFKFGVWPDAYYMSANESTYTAYAFNRTAMLAGNPATFIKFTGETNFLLPADLDGTMPPPAGAPGYFYTFKDNTYASHGGGVDRLEIFEFRPDFVTPANSTFVNVTDLPITAFTYTVCGFFILDCVPQSGAAANAMLDALSEWPMFRLAYRNFGTHEAMVSNFTVDVGSDRAGIRWFELRKTTGAWTLFQQGTHAPGTEHRFTGSIAQDRGGNLALGYSVSSASMFPAIRYATRLTTDPAGTLQTEATLIAGGGSQTATHSRWGDYSAMSVDPADGCTFWFTTEYFQASGSSWNTRIGNFTIPECVALPDYNVSAPAGLAVCRGSSAAATITVGQFAGFSNPVTLSGSGLPANVSVNFVPGTVTPPNSSVATFSATAAATPGSYIVAIVGASGVTTRQDPLQLDVAASAPTAPALTAPADGSTSVATLPLFTWGAVAGAASYTIEIATDPTFTTIVATATVAGTSYTPGTALANDTVYYWRVRASNACGVANSTIRAFRTGVNATCTLYTSTDVPKSISTTGTPSVTSILNVSGSGTISDVNVRNLNGTHTWINDLDFRLQSPGGTTVQIMAQSCGNQDNFNLNLDDEAAGTPGGWPCPPIGGGTYRPSNPLSGFDGLNANGTWTLTVRDNATGDGGSLNGWGLEICVPGSSTASDYSDLPNSYGVAWHTGNGALRLGTGWSSDTSFTANSDDATDDGVSVNTTANWRPGGSSTATVTTNGSGFVAAWFDWNNDGDFTDAGEKALAQNVSAGVTPIPFSIPGSAVMSQPVKARFRLYTSEPPLTEPLVSEVPSGGTTGGEVEDYSNFAPLAVQMANLAATTDGTTVLVAWETSSELGNTGFHVWRGPDASGPTVRLNEALIPSQGPGSSQGFAYEWQDSTVEAGATYFYWVEDVDTSGLVTRHGPVSVTVAPPTAVTVATLGSRETTPPLALLAALALAGLAAAGWARKRRG